MERVGASREVEGRSLVKRGEYPLDKDLTALVLSFLEIEKQREFAGISLDFYRAAQETMLRSLKEFHGRVGEVLEVAKRDKTPRPIQIQLARCYFSFSSLLKNSRLPYDEREARLYRELLIMDYIGYDYLKAKIGAKNPIVRSATIYRDMRSSHHHWKIVFQELAEKKHYYLAKQMFAIMFQPGIFRGEPISEDLFRCYFAEALIHAGDLSMARKVVSAIKSIEMVHRIYKLYIEQGDLEEAFLIAKEKMHEQPYPGYLGYWFTDIPTLLAKEGKWSQVMESLTYIQEERVKEREEINVAYVAIERGEEEREMLEKAYDWLQPKRASHRRDIGFVNMARAWALYHGACEKGKEVLRETTHGLKETECVRVKISGFQLAQEGNIKAAEESVRKIIALGFSGSSYFFDLAILCAKKGDREEAEQYLSRMREDHWRNRCRQEINAIGARR